MTIRRSVLLAFVVTLYIAPAIFAPSYVAPAIGKQSQFTMSASDWLSGFRFRQEISLTGATGCGTNYPVELTVTYDSDMQSDFADLRFTDNDMTTQLGYWIESYTASTTANVWVNVTDNLNVSATIYMYYGNTTTVSSTSNGDNVFVVFDDFEYNNLSRWDITGTDWSTQSSVVESGSYAGYGDATSSRDLYDNVNLTSGSWMIQTYFRVVEVGSYYKYGIHMEDSTFSDISGIVAYSNDWIWWNGGSNYYDENSVVAHEWVTIELGFTFGGDVNLTITSHHGDPTIYATRPFVDYSNNIVTNVTRVGVITAGPYAGKDQYLDDYFLRKWNEAGEPTSSFGAEEDSSSWNVIGSVAIVLEVGFVEWGTNTLFIFLGLCMIPASTLYISKGGRSEVSSTKVFYFLIAFALGWALFLGGIMG